METNICLACLNSSHSFLDDEQEAILSSKFCRFSKTYLQISSPLLNSEHNRKVSFCATCEAVVSSVCQLHQELVSIQLQLSSKLGDLAELLENSQSEDKWTSSHLCNIKSLSKQLDVKYPAQVDTLRSYLKKKCELKRRETSPQVVVNRLVNEPPQPPLGGTENRIDFIDDDPLADINNLTPNFIKTEPLNKETVSQFIDEGEGEQGRDPLETYSPPKLEIDEDERAFEPEASLDEPPSQVKANKREFPCPVCTKVFYSSNRLTKHMWSVHSQKRFNCPEPNCDAVFKQKSNLKHHIAAVHRPQSHICSHCKKEFATAKYLKEHVERVHPIEVRQQMKYRCLKCDKKFLKRFLWERHISRCKMESVQFQMEAPSKSEAGELICPKCDALFKTKANLKRHFADIHNPRPHVCPHCQSCFTANRNLLKHIAQKHPALVEKRLKCKKCGKRFLKRCQWKLHLSTCSETCNPQSVAVSSPPRIKLEAMPPGKIEQFEDETEVAISST